jgi:hypothetical protein
MEANGLALRIRTSKTREINYTIQMVTSNVDVELWTWRQSTSSFVARPTGGYCPKWPIPGGRARAEACGVMGLSNLRMRARTALAISIL